MSQFGHSWMLRRYESYSHYGYGNNSYLYDSYIDEAEYRTNKKALEYYSLAYHHAKTNKFKALCLRMMSYADYEGNTYSKRLKAEFPEYYDDISGCENLEEYFNARR